MRLRRGLKLLSDRLKRLIAYHLNLPLAPPRIINFGMTNRCNFSCPICNTKQEGGEEGEEIGLTVIKNAIRDIAQWNQRHNCQDIKISFAGGEPLIRKRDMIEAVKLSSDLGLKTHLTTNGSLLDNNGARQLIKSGLSSVSVSLDGSNADTNNRLRGEGSFEAIVRGIKRLITCKEETDADVTISTVTVITKQNITELTDIYRFAKGLGVDRVNFNPYALDNSFMAKGDYDQDPFWISANKTGAVSQAVRDIREIKKEKGDIDTPDNVLNNLKDYFKLKGDFKRGKCLAGHSYMHVKPNGEVDVCGKGPSFSSRPMNIKEKNIKSIWRSFNFFVTRLKILRCQRPCLMLCFDRETRGIKERFKKRLGLSHKGGDNNKIR